MRSLLVALCLLVGACRPAADPSELHPESAAMADVEEPRPSGDADVEPGADCQNALFTRTTEVDTEFSLEGLGTLRITWTGALDADQETDFLATVQDSCSGWGECEHAVFWGCGGGYFRLVYGPEYAFSLDPGPRDADGRVQLVRRERWGDAATPELRTFTMVPGEGAYVEASSPERPTAR